MREMRKKVDTGSMHGINLFELGRIYLFINESVEEFL